MAESSAEIAIVGAGPSGAHLASRLAAAGRDVVLFDPKGAWEKPCGGGVPTRAIKEFAFLLEDSRYPRKIVDRITMISPVGRRVTLKVTEPFAIYSREVLNGLVLDRALNAGARFVRAGVNDFSRGSGGWNISTDDGRSWSARFLVGADGAASFTRRRLVGIFPKQDLALAFGYNVKESPTSGDVLSVHTGNRQIQKNCLENAVIMRFHKNLVGYLWAFPRPGAMNFGIASKLGEYTSDELRVLLIEFIKDFYGGVFPNAELTSFYGAKIPILDYDSWSKLRTSGDDWALIGDAAGFVDPITGEGIYYALKSADLMATSLLMIPRVSKVDTIPYQSSTIYSQVPESYERLWREVFGEELKHASGMLPRFYRGYFAGQVFSNAMINIARYHKGVRKVLINLIVGQQSYLTLKQDLFKCILYPF
ncbi:MAG TPA: NAD(P)-binding protein [Blastocatellia bacterium]|jgi:geranylgeranyl reductase family protein|nr:NAD(P)-binding protein [Blastocatellia bacterium]